MNRMRDVDTVVEGMFYGAAIVWVLIVAFFLTGCAP